MSFARLYISSSGGLFFRWPLDHHHHQQRQRQRQRRHEQLAAGQTVTKAAHKKLLLAVERKFCGRSEIHRFNVISNKYSCKPRRERERESLKNPLSCLGLQHNITASSFSHWMHMPRGRRSRCCQWWDPEVVLASSISDQTRSRISYASNHSNI